MVTNIAISGFRSIESISIPMKKVNIMYGPNGSGKSSVAYASCVMKNFFNSPNQRMNSFFNLGFINLGGIENVVNTSNVFGEFNIEITGTKTFFPINDIKQATIGLQLSPLLYNRP